MKKSILFLFVLLTGFTAEARILFEGYYRIEVKGQHRGYSITRHEFDETKKERTMTYYVYRRDEGVVSQSGVRAVSREDHSPIKYSLYEWVNRASSVTEGKFGPKTVEISAPSGKSSLPVLPGSYFSSMITQIMAMAVPAEYQEGLKYTYDGFYEEAAQYDTGRIQIKRSNPFENQMIFQLISGFGSEHVELFTFRNGEVLGSRNADIDTVTYLTPTKELALGDFKLQNASIKKVFGNIPQGATNNPVGQTSGKLNAKEAIEFFPKLEDSDRKPNQAFKHFKLGKQP